MGAKIAIDSLTAQRLIEQGFLDPKEVSKVIGRGRKSKKRDTVIAEWITVKEDHLVFVLPIRTVSEANSHNKWRKNNNSNGAKKIVSAFLGKHLDRLVPFADAYHRGGAIQIKFTRLGGNHLDEMANLGASMKYVEDAVALMIGADDGGKVNGKRPWIAQAFQDTQFKLVGVKIDMRIIKRGKPSSQG